MKGQTTADKIKEDYLRTNEDSKYLTGTIKNINMRDSNYIGGKEKKVTPYAAIEIDFNNGACATVPCDLSEAKDYRIGQKAKVSLEEVSD